MCPCLFIWFGGCLCLGVPGCFLAPWGTFWFHSGSLWTLVAFLWHLGDLGTPLRHLGPPVGHAWGTLWRFLSTLGDLGGPCGHPWPPIGAHLGSILATFNTLGRGPGALWPLWGKIHEKGTKSIENGSQNPDIFNDIWTLCAKWQTAFGSRRRGRIEVWASCFHALGVHWRSLFLLLVFDVFWGPPGATFHGNGGRGGTPYN